MSSRICENCTEERAIANSDLCDTCEVSFDESALQAGVTREEYAKELGLVIV
jgi:hypothetical protein